VILPRRKTSPGHASLRRSFARAMTRARTSSDTRPSRTAMWRPGRAEEHRVEAANAAADRSLVALAPGLSARSTDAPLIVGIKPRRSDTLAGPRPTAGWFSSGRVKTRPCRPHPGAWENSTVRRGVGGAVRQGPGAHATRLRRVARFGARHLQRSNRATKLK
jgi:hypothetical protein